MSGERTIEKKILMEELDKSEVCYLAVNQALSVVRQLYTDDAGKFADETIKKVHSDLISIACVFIDRSKKLKGEE